MNLKDITAAQHHRHFLMLPLRERIVVGLEILRSQTRILFSQRFLWFIGGVLVWFAIQYVINYNEDIVHRYQTEDIFVSLLEFPLIAIAVYLNMKIISSEKENRTLEIMFTTAGSRYRIWLLRIAALNLILILHAFALSLLAYFTFADVPIAGLALNGFVPAFFAGNLTFYFSVKFRSGFAAGMVTAGLLVLVLITAEFLNETRYFLFFNPYDLPRRVDPGIWNLWMWQNRLAILALGLVLLFNAVRNMDRRERLLG